MCKNNSGVKIVKYYFIILSFITITASVLFFTAALQISIIQSDMLRSMLTESPYVDIIICMLAVLSYLLSTYMYKKLLQIKFFNNEKETPFEYFLTFFVITAFFLTYYIFLGIILTFISA